MYNALIFDAERGPCYLVRSILLGKKIAVSIATSIDEARQKIETGLFDMLFASVSGESETELAFLRHVSVLLPGLPIVTIVAEGCGAARSGESTPSSWQPAQSSFSVCRQIMRPLRVGAVLEAATRAIAKVETDAEAASEKQRGIVVSVISGEKSLRCIATTASSHGVLVESIAREQCALREFEEFFATNQNSQIVAALPDSAGGVIRFKARVVFTEKTIDMHLKQVGLKFGEG